MEKLIFGKNKDRFYMGESEDKALAEVTFKKHKDNIIILDHTYVNRSLRGKGMGKILVDRVVAYARENNLKIIPTCPFAKDIMEMSKSYNDVLLSDPIIQENQVEACPL
ncbi:MAG: GNAT family N-acetyltransferase [Bacilli bacterium]|nr:GNAT family N-acetyltransferase [Bacilli bacterium]